MAKIYYQDDANIATIQERKVAVIGYGSQGHAHALNLRDSGVDVVVGLREESKSRERARGKGLTVLETGEAARWGDVIVMLAPDTAQPGIYRESIVPNLKAGKMLMFGHGFNIRFGTIEPPDDIDVTMVAPKAPGHRVREIFQAGGGTPCLLAIHQDATGKAHETTLSYAKALGSLRAAAIETTFTEETETDLFGEQAVLCGGVSALVKAAFEVLVKAGYQPEVAYFECMHELKLIVDLMYRGGLSYMRYSVSDTAEHGDYTAGTRIINEETVGEMRVLLDAIRDGSYAKAWIEENERGRPWFDQQRLRERNHPLEKVGADLRAMMPFLNPVEVSSFDE
ncbi:MAG: ketol-acid reductoisomerase [Anaerolineales bacterium]|nr:ketol-acid reductoisomerase [Anaerolineales bacterium]